MWSKRRPAFGAERGQIYQDPITIAYSGNTYVIQKSS
jgi:hypothetical protein